MSKPETYDILYQIARHLLNPDDIPLQKWAVKGAFLLSRLERLDPEKYAEVMAPEEKVEKR